ncbi:uncharacterized protein G2W53_005982 [Senna tora]|uniref:Uncharacterized protein n=1 Tax=Senna tora TaxID=362788 RepID=A0A834X3R2_9FABA|nr:uncharacterized protein G2W53_005982 [Senna tora]
MEEVVSVTRCMLGAAHLIKTSK